MENFRYPKQLYIYSVGAQYFSIFIFPIEHLASIPIAYPL